MTNNQSAKCPFCGSERVNIHARNPENQTRYYCKGCTRTFTASPKVRKYHHEACPRCESGTRVKSNGFYEGKQRYYCKGCDLSFLTETGHSPKKHMDEQTEDRIISAWLNSRSTMEMLDSEKERSGITLYLFRKIIKSRYGNGLYDEAFGNLRILKKLIRKQEDKSTTKGRNEG